MNEKFSSFIETIDQLPGIIILYREKIIHANRFALRHFGVKLQEIRKKHIWDFLEEECDKKEAKEQVLQRVAGKLKEPTEKICKISVKGTVHYLKAVAATIELEGKQYGILVGIDVTPERSHELLLENIYRYTPDIIVLLDRDGKIVFKSYATTQLGYDPQKVIGANIFDYIHPSDISKFKEILQLAFANRNRRYSVEYRVRNAQGTYVWLEAYIVVPQEAQEAFMIERDITTKKRAQEQLLQLTYYDPLTKLPNKLLFRQTLEGLLKGDNRYVAVIVLRVLNLDQLRLLYEEKSLFASLRELLEEIFDRSIIGVSISREFLIAFYFRKYEEYKRLDYLLAKLQKRLQNFRCCNETLILQYVLGVSIYPKSARSADELITQAQLAALDATKKGNQKISFFSKDIERKFQKQEKILRLLPDAIEKGEMKVYYQPIFDIYTKECKGFETLIRWFSKELGYVPPPDFIPLAEEMEYISHITNFVIDRAMEDIKKLSGDYFVTVNFSAKDFKKKNLLQRVERTAKKRGFDLRRFVIEITETTAMEDVEFTKKRLESFKKKGLQIALDDFGTGYSSMQYLSLFPIDKIKIDLGFVVNIVKDRRYENIVKTIIDLAHSMDAIALAEGVESEEILKKLQLLDCDEGQGFLYAPPLSFEELKKFLGEKKHG